ncbi:DUF3168 domain-containing protein [Kordiimonas sp. SCSIO 12610]|uniref:DUF3168 domain-containing protein n=1 Tax=Kordiimonas sp. SCSIO 12610 TaxID=2829597 RepID=UPI00210E5FC2|nr:DUF3168 domain-containing protein [Kordiimonas sp. SCSIO 12610]UTW56188.1 DUF3168 domain-containing protein [Kordiimonas sp. SCSIO 12610]
MTALSVVPLQVAVYDALMADSDLSARITGIYDEPPAGARMPYIAFGDTSITVADTKTLEGSTVDFDVSVWSGDMGQMEAKEIMALVDSILHTADLHIQGQDLVYLRLQNAGVVRQFRATGSLYRGRLSYRARLFNKTDTVAG